jgi:hypothetical protein
MVVNGSQQALERTTARVPGMDREGRGIYIGTFSRTFFSSLRIGSLIAPNGLSPAITTAKWLWDRHTATLEGKRSQNSFPAECMNATWAASGGEIAPVAMRFSTPFRPI